MSTSANSKPRSPRPFLLRNRGFEAIGIVTREQERFLAKVAELPHITIELMRMMRTLGKYGHPTSPYHYLAASDSPDARTLMQTVLKVPELCRPHVPIEALCYSAKVSPPVILDAITVAAIRSTRLHSVMLSSAAHPVVVEKTIDMALTDEGIQDRITLHKATGFLPSPKGAQTIVNVQQQNAMMNAPTVSLPAPEDTIRRLTDRLNAARGIEPAVPALPVEVVEVESDEDGDED